MNAAALVIRKYPGINMRLGSYLPLFVISMEMAQALMLSARVIVSSVRHWMLHGKCDANAFSRTRN